MNPNLYEMEGSPQTTHQFNGSNQPNYNVDNTNVILFPTLDNQLVPFESLNGHQGLLFSPSHCPNGVISDPNCRFHCEVLDDCAKARFYARTLEFYLLDDEGDDLNCPFKGCQARNFKNLKDMLRHLKHCPLFDEGVFRCPLCNRYESFRVQSSRRCRWNKKHLGQKLKNMFRSFVGNRPETQKPVHNGLCYQCSAPLDERSMQGTGHATPFIPMQSIVPPMQSTIPPMLPIQRQVELDAQPCLELSTEYSSPASRAGDSSSENSPKHAQLQPNSSNLYLTSEVSSATTSLEGSIVSVSPGSSHHDEIPAAVPRHNPWSKLKKASRPLTEFRSEASSSSGIENQRSLSLCENFPTSESLGFINPLVAGTLIGSANLPATPTPNLGPPQLRIDTSPPIQNSIVAALGCEVSLYGGQIVNYPVTADTQTAVGLPTNRTHSLPSGGAIDALSPGENFLTAQELLDSSINPSPSASSFLLSNSQQESPSSPPSETELRCHRSPQEKTWQRCVAITAEKERRSKESESL
ncbi:hypothetical protein FHL15_006999 [Xylaria flabelliformis]|uniref:Uncharacterized protein n=1 Tax=Xylaria flabelliformis TaxID=2512241 RepID=A0A553HW08_9PEZI|nr:hypothetical protein FHL15_006999 [Xylaria flabelliformis]